MGSRVLHGLGLMDAFKAASEPMGVYEMRNGHGEMIHSYPLGEALAEFDYTGTLLRGELLHLLRTCCEDVPLQFDTRVESFEERGDEVIVRLSDGSEKTCDLLVGADGIHSAVRRQLLGAYPDKETGWGCWVWIARNVSRPPTTVTEYWSAGRFMGVYPIKGGAGVVAAGATRTIGPAAVGCDGAKAREYFAAIGGHVGDILAELPDDLANAFWWNLSDYSSERWTQGRVALLGDSACAFLPTAGVGASMALESAAVLDDELGRTDARHLPWALKHYEKRRKHRAEAFQSTSRNLAAMMAVDSAPLAWSRDQMMKFYTLEMLIKQIGKAMAEPI